MFGLERSTRWVLPTALMLVSVLFVIWLAVAARAACDPGDYTIGGSCPAVNPGVDISLSCADECCTWDNCQEGFYTGYGKIYKLLYDGTQVPIVYGRGAFLGYAWDANPCECALT
jgi:hypothetical protein